MEISVDFEPMHPGFESVPGFGNRIIFFLCFFFFFFFLSFVTVQIQNYCLYSDSPSLFIPCDAQAASAFSALIITCFGNGVQAMFLIS